MTILNEGLMPGMDIIGERFKKNDIFIPEVLIAARAMAAGTDVLRPSSWATRWKKRAPSSSAPSRTTSTTSARTLSA
ncbi:MAG: B12-binding domain-containing protein [Bilophila wadsworthia]